MISRLVHGSCLSQSRITRSLSSKFFPSKLLNKERRIQRISSLSSPLSYHSNINIPIKSTPSSLASSFIVSSPSLSYIRLFHPSLSTPSNGTNLNKDDHETNNTDIAHININIDIDIDGEYCYQKAMVAIQNKEQEELEQEQQQAMEQYQAMEKVQQKTLQRQQQKQQQNQQHESQRRQRTKSSSRLAALEQELHNNQNNNRAAGVAVIRTITRQAREKQQQYKEKQFQQQYKTQIDITKTSSSSSSSIPTSHSLVDNNNSPKVDWEAEESQWLEKAAHEFLHPKALVRLGNKALQQAKTFPILKESSTSSSPSLPPHFYMDVNHSISNPNWKQELEQYHFNPAQKAAYLYKLAGQQQSKEGWFNLGHLLWTGFPELSEEELSENETTTVLQLLLPNKPASLNAFEKAIALQDADAMYFVGVQLLLLPENEEENYENNIRQEEQHQSNHDFPPPPSLALHPQKQRGLSLVQKAAQEYHHGGAMHYLALLYLNGDPELHVSPCTPSQFQTLLDQAADIGHNPDAMYLRAHSYYHGDTFECYSQNFDLALQGFQQAGEFGSSEGAVSAGVMYYQQGDYQTAFEWYQKAAEMGNKEGWRNLVRCYALGEGVMKSDSTAKHIAKLMLSDDDDDN